MKKSKIIIPLTLALTALVGCDKTEYFEVSFETGGGTVIASQRIKKGEKMTRPSNPVKRNAEFVFWCSDAKLENEFKSFNDPVTKSFTLYAKYATATEIYAIKPTKSFSVGDEITKDDITVFLSYDIAPSKTLSSKDWTCDEFKDGKYTFSLEDIYKDGEIIDGKTFNISYDTFKCKTTISPNFSDSTKFSMQYVNLLKEDKLEHAIIYDAKEGMSFESSNQNKLKIVSTNVIDNQYVIEYQLTNNEDITKTDKLFIKAISNSGTNPIVDYALIHIYDNSDNSLSFIDDDETDTSSVYCSLSSNERTKYDPYGNGTLFIPTYNLRGQPVISVSSESGSALGAFSNCSQIEYVELPETLQHIGKNAFNSTGLQYIYIPKNTITIGDLAFNGNKKLLQVDIPSDSLLMDLGAYAFQNCVSLTSFKVPKNVIKIEKGCFNLCENLFYFMVSSDSMLTSIGIEAFNGVSKSALNDEEDATYLIAYDEEGDKNEHFCLLDIANNENVVEYDVSSDCLIISISKASEFEYLETLNVSNSVISIADHCFMDCTTLENVNIDIDNSRLLGIGEQAFSCSTISKKMNIKTINIPSSTVYIGRSCFEAANTELTDVVFKDDKGWSTFDSEGKIIEFHDLNDSKAAAQHLIYDITDAPLRKI